MDQNMGTADRVIRVLIGIWMLYMGYTYSAWIYALALLMFVTAMSGFCGLYIPFGIKTN